MKGAIRELLKFDEVPEEEMMTHPVFASIKEKLQVVQRKLTKRPAIEARIRVLRQQIQAATKVIHQIDAHMTDLRDQRQEAVKDHKKYTKLINRAEITQVAKLPSENRLHQLKLIMNIGLMSTATQAIKTLCPSLQPSLRFSTKSRY